MHTRSFRVPSIAFFLGSLFSWFLVAPNLSSTRGTDSSLDSRLGRMVAPILEAQGPPFLSGPVRLLASQTLFFPASSPVLLTSSNVTVNSGPLVGNPLFTVDLPADRSRTHLVALANASYTRHQVISSATVRFTGFLTINFASSVLPAPGTLNVILVGLETLVEEAGPPSDHQVSYVFPYARAVEIESGTVLQALNAQFPSLSPQQREQLAADLIRAASTVTVTPTVDIRSIDHVRFSPIRAFQIWGG